MVLCDPECALRTALKMQRAESKTDTAIMANTDVERPGGQGSGNVAGIVSRMLVKHLRPSMVDIINKLLLSAAAKTIRCMCS